MPILDVPSYAAGNWIAPDTDARTIASAITGDTIARAGSAALDTGAMHRHARDVGGPALRALTFHDRARMLKALALHLQAHKQVLYDLSFDTGATQSDHAFDIDGGIGTMFVYAAKGRREMPDARIYLDGALEPLSRDGSFSGQHVCVPLQGAGVHINAYNFPVWGMLEKFAPTFLAGVPSIVKPATATCYVTQACVALMVESGILPDGALQMIAGGTGDLLQRLDAQDVVSFTGSAETALGLRSTPHLLRNAVRFVAEQDSLNASVLGPDVSPGSAEFDLFIREAHREMTTKAGQKCTAIRRIIAPQRHVDAVIDALSQKLLQTKIGDPRDPETGMGALVSLDQRRDVLEKAAMIGSQAQLVCGDRDGSVGNGIDTKRGAFLSPMLFHCTDPDDAPHVHDTEAFGPVSTVMPYRDTDHAIALLNRGKGSLVASIITNDTQVARDVVAGAAAWHGRLYFNNADSMAASTGHGAPMPHMVHGGPGRAGGGEELGGVRGVLNYMQRTAVQGGPDILTAIGDCWVPGATVHREKAHPFTRSFHALQLGETFESGSREVTLDDIETFAHFTGDTFYAHMDEDAARANPFFPGRVAHGYLLISFAAGLFVQPDPGPVLANTGLDALRFMKPVSPGDHVQVQLTVKKKTPRNAEYGEVRWHVSLTNQDAEQVAEYELLTMVSYS
ncbi:phenylacetic acid degradation bifunctional protein PaaZ [Sulfitobacter sp. S190]|uniref:phenylacetic acid degradation bifunctional protein PaaZ n=1 Tax=Sulfitobacter sp. S190 TaxID=2867022 RepID=UPI0021A51E49|nr:phenylacetic acid degradation bifunctional protein PaaZ [Sulfitobacter sp. S190]UWR20968.1 phenylacetic acid degradation bifunctional protein PaaZ [Sulfitobacter sp. S190]